MGLLDLTGCKISEKIASSGTEFFLPQELRITWEKETLTNATFTKNLVCHGKNLETLKIKCEKDIYSPDLEGGCQNSKKCILGNNHCIQCNENGEFKHKRDG